MAMAQRAAFLAVLLGHAGGASLLTGVRCYQLVEGYAFDDIPDVVNQTYVKVDAMKNYACGLRVDGWVDCWTGEDLAQMPERALDFTLSRSTICLASTTGGVVCYAGWQDFVRGTFTRSTALDGVVVRSLGAVDMYSSDRQICGLDEAGALHCQSDLAAPENVTGTKIVGNGYFFCVMQQAAPSSVVCWAHDDDPYGVSSYGPLPQFRTLPEDVGMVYDMDAWGFGGAFCVLNATKMVHCYNHLSGNNGGVPPPVMDFVDNSGAPYSELAVGSRSVCAVREETGTLQCWGQALALPNAQRPEDLGRVGGIAMGGVGLCVAATTTSTTTTASTTSTTMTTTSTSSTTTASSSSTTSATMTTVTSSSSSSTSATSTSSSTGTTTTTTRTETATTVTSTGTATTTSSTTSRTTSTSTRTTTTTSTETVSTTTRTATSTSSTTGTSTTSTVTPPCFGDICVTLETSGAKGKGALAALASVLLLAVAR